MAKMLTETLQLDFGPHGDTIGGLLLVDGNAGTVVVKQVPPGLTKADARGALVIAVLDGLCKVSDEASIAVDLIGSAPRVI